MIEANNFNVVKKTRLEKSQFVEECNIDLTCSKVLSVSVAACVLSSEVVSGTVSYSGSIDVRLVYMTEDGEIGALSSACPFTSRFEGDYITNGQKAIIEVKVVDSSIENIASGSIRLNVNLEQSGVLIGSNEVMSIATSDSDICTKTEDIKVIRYIGEATENVTVNTSFSARENIKKLILTESQVLIKNVESGVNFVSVSGEVITRVLYLNDSDKFESTYAYEAFKEEIELEGATREGQVEGYGFVKCDGVKTEIEESDKGVNIKVETPVLLAVKAYEEGTVTVIKDLYSTTSDIKVNTSSFDMTVVCPMEVVEGKIDGSLTLDDDKPRVDKILFVGGNNVVVSNSYIKDGEINIEGIASSTVVYLNDDTNTLNSVQIDVPFVLSDKFNQDNVEGILDVNAIVCDVDVIVKKGRELYYDAKVKADVNYCHPVVSGVISEATIAESYPEREYGLELLFARAGQDAWDIAKEAKITEEMLIAQNPETVFPLAEDKNLILFYQKG